MTPHRPSRDIRLFAALVGDIVRQGHHCALLFFERLDNLRRRLGTPWTATLQLRSRRHWTWAFVCMLALGGALVSYVRITAPTAPAPEKAYVAFFMGQGGYFLSWGIPYLAWQARRLGMEADVFEYSEVREAWQNIARKKAEGYKIALVGYSLGNSTATYLQKHLAVDLLLAIAQSSLGRNHRIEKDNTRRSVLWYGPDFLSNAGLKNGFDEINYINAFHLWMDVDARVVTSVLHELKDLAQEDNDGSHPTDKPTVPQTISVAQADGIAANDAASASAQIASDQRLPVSRGVTCTQCRGFQVKNIAK